MPVKQHLAANALAPADTTTKLRHLHQFRSLAKMPCVHCTRHDSALAASTSSRCLSSASIQRVPQYVRSYKQLERQLRRSRAVVQRAVFQCSTRWQQQTQQRDSLVSQQFTQDHPTQTQSSPHFGRCMVQGFAAAALLSLLAPGPSYSAESIPIGLLKSWIVSHRQHICMSINAIARDCLQKLSVSPACRNKLRALDLLSARSFLC